MNNGTTGTVFRDAVFLALLGFAAMVVMLIPFINPPTQLDEIPAPGNVIVELRWQDGTDVDVDLWVKGPGDKPVGYSRKSGLLFDLLRDDLGAKRDETALNYEFSFSRGAPAGEYAVNAHLFAMFNAPVPVSITMVVTVRRNGNSVVIAKRTASLDFRGQEITLARFALDANGNVVPGSLHDLPIPLRAVGGGP